MFLAQSTQSWLLGAALLGCWLGLRISLSAFTKISWALNFQLNSHQMSMEETLSSTWTSQSNADALYLFICVLVRVLFGLFSPYRRGENTLEDLVINCSRDHLDSQLGLTLVQNSISP